MTEKVTFNAAAAEALLDTGRDVVNREGSAWESGHPNHETSYADRAPWHLADDEPLTAAQASAACKADPSLCVRGRIGGRTSICIYAFRGGRWVEVEDPEVGSVCAPEGENPYDAYVFAKPKSQPQRPTLTFPPDPMRPCWRDGDGYVRRLRDADSGETFELWSTVRNGWVSTWYPGLRPHTPCDEPKPKVEPRSGAALRRWLVANPGRRAVDDTKTETWWDAEECAFRYGRFCATHPASRPFTPADGGPW